MPDHEAVVVYVTAPPEQAERIAESIVRERLAACVNVLPGVRSLYWWQGEIERDDEALLLVKTDAGHVEALTEHLRDVHPYEVPEVLAVPVVRGSPAYLEWLHGSMEATPG